MSTRPAIVAAAIVMFILSVVPTAVAQATTTRALVVVDVQEDCTGSIVKPPFLFQSGSDTFIAQLNELITRANAAKVVVVYLRTNLKMEDGPGARIDHRLKVVGSNCFLKDSLDAFASSNHSFADFLQSNQQISELDFVGLDATLCVYATAKAAVRRGYRTNVALDAVKTISGKSRGDLEAMYRTVGIGVTSQQALLSAY